MNLRILADVTHLSQLWDLFQLIINASPLDANGYYTLTLARDIIEGIDIDYVTQREFWVYMAYMLNRKNHMVMLERKRKRRIEQDKRRGR